MFFDRQGRCLKTNIIGLSIMGYQMSEVLGRKLSEFSPEIMRPAIESAVDKVLKGEQIPLEIMQIRSDQPAIIWSAILNPVTDRAGNIYGFVGIFSDITERKHAEEQLRESEERYRQLVELSPDAIFIQSEGRIVYINAAGARLFGAEDRTQILGKQVLEIIHPDYLEIVGGRMRQLQEEKTGVPLIEEKFLRLDGTPVDVEVGATPFVYQGKPAVQVIARDIRGRKLVEEALQESKEKISQILNSTAEGIYGLDLDGNCTFCNPSSLRILGYHNEEALIGKNMHDLIHHTKANGTSYPKDECASYRAIAKGEYIHRDRETFWRSNGTSFPVEYWSHPIFKDNAIKGAVVTFIDITKRVALENQLLHAQKMEAVGTLSGGIAHDFNNILSSILGYADLLHMKIPVDDPLRTNVEAILESVDRAAQLTHSLLAFSRNQLMAVKAIDLNDLISRLEKMLVRIIGEDIEFRTEFREKSLVIMADSGQIEQVIMNLATNARDAMPKGGSLKIVTDLADIDEAVCEAHGCEMPGEYVVITVSDTGMGMSEETRERMFDPFFTTKDIGKGTGLGLSIVYGIVMQHNGFIDVDSEQGIGTAFRIYLPATRVAVKKTESTPTQHVDKGTETLLVAEDDPALRELSKIVLESFGYKVILAEDGQDAVRKFAANNEEIGLIILDMMMPKMTGVEAYEAIRRIRPEVKALFLSGYTADKVMETGLIADGMDIVMKPILPRDLLRKVRKALDSSP